MRSDGGLPAPEARSFAESEFVAWWPILVRQYPGKDHSRLREIHDGLTAWRDRCMWRVLRMILRPGVERKADEILGDALEEVEQRCRNVYDPASLVEAEDRFDRDVLAGAGWQERCIRYRPRRGANGRATPI